MTHEYGHVHFHAYLWELNPPTPDLLKQMPLANKQICKRETIIGAKETDWMEWQAGYICGALLVPASPARDVLRDHMEKHDLFGALQADSPDAGDAVRIVVDRFQVSQEAARLRLLQLGVLATAVPARSLFNQ